MFNIKIIIYIIDFIYSFFAFFNKKNVVIRSSIHPLINSLSHIPKTKKIKIVFNFCHYVLLPNILLPILTRLDPFFIANK